MDQRWGLHGTGARAKRRPACAPKTTCCPCPPRKNYKPACGQHLASVHTCSTIYEKKHPPGHTWIELQRVCLANLMSLSTPSASRALFYSS